MRKYDWSEEKIRDAVARANCWFECLDLLSVPKRGGNNRTLKSKVFHIHHIDGDHKNNVKTNLVLLCPNCHSQTDNYSNRKR